MEENRANDDGGVPKYIIEFINKIADREGFTNYTVTNSVGSSTGDGYQGQMLRFKLNGQQNNVSSTLSLICKLPPADIFHRELVSDVIFRREIFFYDQLLPYFAEFQRENGISETDGFYSFPKCYGTILDGQVNGNHAVILEDLLVKNYSLGDKLNIDYDRAKLVLIELGKFHAVSFAIRDKNPEKLEALRKETINYYHRTLYSHPVMLEFLNGNIEKAIGTLDSHEVKLIEQLQAMKGTNILEIMEPIFSSITPGRFGVIVHGDLWSNNILYHTDASGVSSKLSFIDWQMSQFGSPALDVAHYIFCSLDHDIRSKHYHEFLDLYYNSLAQTLQKFGCNAEKLFTFDDLKDQLRQFGRICLIAGPILCQIMTADPDEIPDGNDAMKQLQDKMEMGESTELVNMFGSLAASFKCRMNSLLRDCERYGFI